MRKLFKSLAPFDDKELDEAGLLFEDVHIARNGFFNKAGIVSDRIGFVEKGVLRSFYNIDNREITTYFLLPGSVAASLMSFLQKKPAIENIQAIEDSLLNVINRTNLYRLYHENWKWQQVGRILTENYYVEMEQRSITLQYQSARERYEALLKDHPEIIRSVPQNMIASYLGIAPETLSRIRKQI